MLATVNFSAVRVARDHATTDALAQAKAALIAYAVSDPNRPGELPCPDVNNDGALTLGVDFIGSNCVNLLGRLPWRTLGLPDLRDDSGERLWYAVSNDFHAGGSLPLNSDTAFRPGNTTLTLSGLQQAANVLAIVFAPGPALVREGAASIQDRSPAGTLNPVNYLDTAAGGDNADGNTAFLSSPQSATFNDRLLPVYSDDIMALVARRAGRELAQYLRSHFDSWQTATGTGFYPWAAPFNPLGASNGAAGTVHGSLPLSTTLAVWTSASAGCGGVGTNELTCVGIFLPLFGATLFTVNATVANIGNRFYDAPGAGNVSVDTGLLLLGGATSNWTINRPSQQLNFSYSASNTVSSGVVAIRIRAPATSAWTGSSWVIDNEWHHLAYYGLSPDFAVNGSGICGACITIANTASPMNKEAVLIMAGRALQGLSQAVRPVSVPPGTVGDFLEGANAAASPATPFFAAGAQTSTFNDHPVAVRP